MIMDKTDKRWRMGLYKRERPLGRRCDIAESWPVAIGQDRR